MKNMLYFLLLLLFAASCAKDNGNYDYTPINTIMIDSIHDAYAADQFDTLKITPVLNYTLQETENLSYEWIIGEKVISTEKNCHVVLNMPPALSDAGSIAAYDALLCVTNLDNGLKYYKNFKVTINIPFGNAMFLLSERADGTANLAYRRMDRINAPIIDSVYENVNPTFGSLGSKPRQVFYSNNLESIMVLCEEGDKRLVLLDQNYMTLKKYYADKSVKGGYNGKFTPGFINMNREGVIVGGGNLFGFNYVGNETLVLGAEGDWELADWAGANERFMAYMWLVYDNKYDRFLTLGNEEGMTYTKVVPLESDEFSTEGQEFLAAGAVGGQFSGLCDKRIILYNENEQKAYFYQVDLYGIFNYESYNVDWYITYEKTMEKSGLVDKNSVCLVAPKSKYWYLSQGKKIRRLFADGGEAVDFYSASDGDVVCMMTDEKEEYLFVVTYNGTYSYLHTVSMIKNPETGATAGEEVGKSVRMEGKVVSMVGRNMHKWIY